MGRTKTEATGADFGKNDPGSKYGQGQDVGHGPNHDCLQCRIARKALVEQAHIRSAMERRPSDGDPDTLSDPEREKLDPFIGLADDIKVEGVSDQPPASTEDAGAFNEIAERNTIAVDRIDPASGPDRSVTVSDLTPPGLPLRKAIPIEEVIAARELQPGTAARFKTQPTRMLAELSQALDAAWVKAGLLVEGEIVDAIEIVDELQGAMPGLGVMLMQGYIPNDRRWHVEMTTGNLRAHIKFIDRDIAIKLCALTLLDGVKGAEFERALAPYNDPDPLAHFTGLSQAKP